MRKEADSFPFLSGTAVCYNKSQQTTGVEENRQTELSLPYEHIINENPGINKALGSPYGTMQNSRNSKQKFLYPTLF